MRYQRIREEAKHEHLKKIGEIASGIFKKEKDLKGVIISGPGPLKEKFNEGEFLHYEIKKKVLGVVDTSYTGFQGLEEAVHRGESLIQEAAAVKEKLLMQGFFTHLQKEDGLAVYKLEDVRKAIDYGAVEILLISESFDEKMAEELEGKAKDMGSEVEIISVDSREGEQLVKIGGIGAILRFRTTS